MFAANSVSVNRFKIPHMNNGIDGFEINSDIKAVTSEIFAEKSGFYSLLGIF
jgi:hypothetical protein